MRSFLLVVLVGFLPLQFESCVTNSEGRKAYNIVPEIQMASMGSQAYEEIIAGAKAKGTLVSKDSKLFEVVERIGRRIATASGVDYQWDFIVINEPKTINAFCLPGGKIAVYTGIFPIAQDEASLAAVLGHEVAHATLHHGAERMSQQLTLAGLSAVAEMSMKDSKFRDIAIGVFGMGAQYGLILPFSRSHESEADAVGLKYAAVAGYTPGAAVGLWGRMGATGKAPPEFMSTHPDPANRKAALAEKQSDVLPYYERSDKQPNRPLPAIN